MKKLFKSAIQHDKTSPFNPQTACQSRKFGFTLAEVLITLAVIGVVAALTIPTLVQNYKRKVVETRLVNFYNIINQALQLSEIDNGDKSTWRPETTSELWAYFEPYIKYTKVVSSGRDVSKNGLIYVYLPDGSVVGIAIYNDLNSDNEVSAYSYGGHFILFPYARDAQNGEKFDKYGKEYFCFGFWPAGTFTYFGFHKGKGVIPYVAHWDGNADKLKTDKSFGCDGKGSGQYCTKLIELNGWKIPDDYPFKF